MALAGNAPQQCLYRLPLPQLQGAFLEVINSSAFKPQSLLVTVSPPLRGSDPRGDSSQKRAVDSNECALQEGLNVASLMLCGPLQSDSNRRIPRRRQPTGESNLLRLGASKSAEVPRTQDAG